MTGHFIYDIHTMHTTYNSIHEITNLMIEIRIHKDRLSTVFINCSIFFVFALFNPCWKHGSEMDSHREISLTRLFKPPRFPRRK